MELKKILIYGANGYTGKLFAKHLISKGIKPVLAARSNKLEQTAGKLNCPTRIFDADDAANHLHNIDVVVNLAGPFAATQDGLIKGCIQSKTSYLDIAGEYPEMENAFKYDSEAKNVGIILLPAAGFGVVPTDIAAKLACDQINDPTHLTIAYATVGGASRGTLKTILKNIHKSGHILIDGQYQRAQPAQNEMKVDVFGKHFKAVYNPWRADLFTAQRSTGTNNISMYSEFPGFIVSMMKGKLQWLRNLLLNYIINFLPEGPSEKQLKKGNTHVKAIAKNDSGALAAVELKGPEAYKVTVLCLEKMLHLVVEAKDKSGCLTPSMLGTGWLKEMEGVKIK